MCVQGVTIMVKNLSKVKKDKQGAKTEMSLILFYTVVSFMNSPWICIVSAFYNLHITIKLTSKILIRCLSDETEYIKTKMKTKPNNRNKTDLMIPQE